MSEWSTIVLTNVTTFWVASGSWGYCIGGWSWSWRLLPMTQVFLLSLRNVHGFQIHKWRDLKSPIRVRYKGSMYAGMLMTGYITWRDFRFYLQGSFPFFGPTKYSAHKPLCLTLTKTKELLNKPHKLQILPYKSFKNDHQKSYSPPTSTSKTLI
jgi:hypothetical protein